MPQRDPAADRAALLAALRARAILRAGPGQPVRTPDGVDVPWMLYTWPVTLSGEGSALVGSCMLERLRTFESTQLATSGNTGLPLVLACVAHGGGRYAGLHVRERRKAYGSCRRVDGAGDRSRPVVVVDDSLCSGGTMSQAIAALEGEGYRVEGGLCLVNLPWGGGRERLRALGYRVETLFEVTELEPSGPRAPSTWRELMPAAWAEPPIEDGLHPAVAARRVAERWLRTREVPRPPRAFDAPYDGRGGAFVSFRVREGDERLARDGFFHLDAGEAEPTRDLVLAAVEALRSAPEVTRERLPALKLAVTFAGPLERVTPSQLDYARYGIWVRSADGVREGGALPNTQCFVGEVEQYQHARWTNASVSEVEPHELYRYEVRKLVEPGEDWPRFGAPLGPAERGWIDGGEVGRRLVARARELLQAVAAGAEPAGAPVPDELIPAPVFGIGASLHRRGVVGCAVSWGDTLDACLRRAVEEAWRDERFAAARCGAGAEAHQLAVSVLHDQEPLGCVLPEQAASSLRRGLDALSLQHGSSGDFLLPSACVHEDWTKEEMARALLDKAGHPRPPTAWATYSTAGWLERRGRDPARLAFGFPDRAAEPYSRERWPGDVALLASYLIEHQRPDGLPEYGYRPVQDVVVEDEPVARPIHALWALAEAGRQCGRPEWSDAAARGLRRCLDDVRELGGGRAALSRGGAAPDPGADSVLLLALSAAGGELGSDPRASGLAARVRALVQPDGRVTEQPVAPGLEADHEILPGLALLALARYAALRREPALVDGLDAAHAWYRRHFRLAHPWGMVGWHPQAWAAVHALSGREEHAALAFEIADWALPWQHERSGAFVCDMQPEGLSFHSGFLAEGMAEAAVLAARLGQPERAARYRRSAAEALRFTNRLVVREEDTFCMANPGRALGGVRGALFLSEVRIDFVSHTLLALLKGLEAHRSE